MTRCSFDVAEGSYFMGGVMAITGLMAAVLTLSGLFHSALRRLGQPSIISHLLAGVVVGPTVLGRMIDLRPLGMEDAGRALSDSIYYVRIVFMFFIGLEMDMRYLRRYLRGSLALALGGSTLCLLFAAAAGPYFYGLLHPGDGPFERDKIQASTMLFMLVLTSTASPVLTRIVTELKLTSCEAGQLAIGAAFANDIANLAVLSVMVVNPTSYSKDGNPKSPSSRLASLPTVKALVFLWMALNVWISSRLVVWMAKLLNSIKQGRQYISKYELFALLMLIVGLSQHVQSLGYSGSMTGFLIGLSMPREGPTARTLVDRLAYPVHQLIMPICFGVLGARLDFAKIGRYTTDHLVVTVAFTALLSSVGRVAGTVMAGRLIGIPPREALVLGLLLNVKGYADILAINFADKMGIWDDAAQGVILLSSIINTFMAGPASAAIVRQQRRAFLYHSHCLQDLKADQELRVLVCVHGVGNVHAMLTLSELSKGTTPVVVVYLLHLIELVTARKYAITHLYHDSNVGTDDDRWGHAREINQVVAAINTFTTDTFIPVRQMTAISNLVSMDTDVCNGIEDVHASLVIVPFHKEQRYDGRMVCRRKGRRLLNQRILQRAPCTVGILVERSQLASIAVEGDERSVEAAQDTVVHQVVAVFLGGPDDREAVAYATRLAAHPAVSVMVSRFLPAQESMDGGTEVRSIMSSKSLMSCKSGSGDLVAVAVGEADEESMEDEEFMADFHARFVAPGHVAYTERYVSDGAEMVDSLGSMARTYSLFVVGKGSGDGNGTAAEMTSGMGGLDEECPELGHIGELLASDDLVGCTSSVLVLQQHKMHQKMRRWEESS